MVWVSIFGRISWNKVIKLKNEVCDDGELYRMDKRFIRSECGFVL